MESAAPQQKPSWFRFVSYAAAVAAVLVVIGAALGRGGIFWPCVFLTGILGLVGLLGGLFRRDQVSAIIGAVCVVIVPIAVYWVFTVHHWSGI